MCSFSIDFMDRVTNITWKTASGATLGGFAFALADLRWEGGLGYNISYEKK